MNQAQLTSLVKQVANASAGALTAHGLTRLAHVVNAEDTTGLVVLIAIWAYSHFVQHTDQAEATPTPLPASKVAGTPPPVVAILACAGLALAVGCASFNANTYNAERTAADASIAATHAFNLYYDRATNGATTNQLASLNATRDKLYAMDVEMSHALQVCESLRASYNANASDTNKTALAIALGVVADESSNIVQVVNMFQAMEATQQK